MRQIPIVLVALAGILFVHCTLIPSDTGVSVRFDGAIITGVLSCGGSTTVTLVVADAVELDPVQVSRYTELTDGITISFPEVTLVPDHDPLPVHESAPLETQVNVTGLPADTVAVEGENVLIETLG